MALTSWEYSSSNASRLVISLLSLKLLFLPAYRSTDFEVHRNWLALTHSLPISKWYYEKTSEWTLDYPPLFAWFKYLLSHVARLFDPAMLQINNINYASFETILFQRLSVLFGEALFCLAAFRYFARAATLRNELKWAGFLLTILSPGLLIVDNIHFQYNCFLYGILILSLDEARSGNFISSSILFAILLNLKHIYLYIAPAYFVYFFSGYCLTPAKSLSMSRFISLGISVITIFGISFGPFISHLQQVLSRLFPFKRGLCHTYPAANVYSIFYAADRFLAQIGKRIPYLQFQSDNIKAQMISRGLLGDVNFSVLPDILPFHTTILTLASHLAGLLMIWKNPSYHNFLCGIITCAYGSFLFGWHVHEKAILLVLVPFSLLVMERMEFYDPFALVSISGIFALFPLLIQSAETPIKITSLLLYVLLIFHIRNDVLSKKQSQLNKKHMIYYAGFVPVQLFYSFGAKITKYEYLPILLVSCYSAVGIIWSWLSFHKIWLQQKIN